MDDREPLWMPLPVIAAHAQDGRYREIHYPGIEHKPHSHIIKEVWPDVLKNAAAAHIDQSHRRGE